MFVTSPLADLPDFWPLQGFAKPIAVDSTTDITDSTTAAATSGSALPPSTIGRSYPLDKSGGCTPCYLDPDKMGKIEMGRF